MYKTLSARCLSVLLPVCLYSFCSAQRLIVYPATEALPRSPDFEVKARIPDKEWEKVPVYQTKVADGRNIPLATRETSFAVFDFAGRVDVEIVVSGRSFSSVRIRPLADSIRPVVKGNTIRFSLDRPRNLSVELDGDIFDNLELFAGAPEVAVPDKADTNTLYYGPGMHEPGTVHLTSGKRVYLAGGALVKAQFLIDHQENIRIEGRGILVPPSPEHTAGGRRDALRIDFSRNVTIDGIIVLPNAYTVLMGSSRHIKIRNIKSFSSGGNNDGIDVFCSQDVLIDSVFLRNSDDCIAVYGHRWKYYGNTRDVTVSHSILWADVAHPILVGTHGDPAHPDTLEHLRFSDLDILDEQEHQLDYQGCMSLDAGDSNLIRDVVFDRIRVEDFREGQLVNLRVMFNKKYNTAPGKGIEEVLFNDITYNGSRACPSVIAGYDDAHAIWNIVFRGLRINNMLITDTMAGKPAWYKTSDMARFFVGEHVEGLKFEK